YQYRPAAAIIRWRLAVGEHLLSLRQPSPQLGLENPESLAVHDAHAAPAAHEAMVEEFDQHRSRLVAVQPVQVDAVLDRPVAAAQLAQRLVRHALAQIAQFLARLECFLDRKQACQAFRKGCGLVAPALLRHRRRRGRLHRYAFRALEWLDVGNGLAEFILHAQPIPSRNFSASSAAMQPVPALVTAWR